MRTWISCAVMLLRNPLGAGAHMTGSDWAGLLSGYELGTAAIGFARTVPVALLSNGSPSVSVSV